MRGRNSYILYLANIIVFIVLEAVALWLISRNSLLQRSEIIKSVSAVTNGFAGASGSIGMYFNLKEINNRLAEENTALRMENDRLRAALDSTTASVPDITAGSGIFDYIPAAVVSNSTDRLHNIIIVNKGLRDGIREDMGVITDRGIIGYVVSAGEHYSRISSILDIDNMISGTLSSSNTFGVLQWNARSPRRIILHDIPVHTDIPDGDTVVSSGYSLIYPAGIPVGTVTGREIRDGNNYDLTVELFEEFSRLRHVYIAVRKDIDELQKLSPDTTAEEGKRP